MGARPTDAPRSATRVGNRDAKPKRKILALPTPHGSLGRTPALPTPHGSYG